MPVGILTRARAAVLPQAVAAAVDLEHELDDAQLRALSVDDLVSALEALIATARGDGDEGLSEEAMDRYEELEGALARARRSTSIRTRAGALGVPSSAIHVGTPADDDGLERAFIDYLRTGTPNADLMELRAQSEGTGSEGGYTVPESFRTKLVERMKAVGGILGAVETITTSDGRPMPFPTIDDTANEAEIVAENAAPVGGADLVFGEKVLGAYKYMSVGAGGLPLRVSWELLQDSAFDIEALLVRLLGKRIARAMSADAVNGDGTGEPLGLVYGKTPVEPVAATGHTYADLLEIVHAVDPDYRQGAVWAMSDSALAAFEGITDGNDRPLWMPGGGNLSEGPSNGRLLGYPVVIDQSFATYNAADDDLNMGAFGNLREGYVWREVKDVTLVVDPFTRALNGQTQFVAWARGDGAPQDANAYVAFSGFEA